MIRYRQRQIKELVKFVNKSDADFVLLGGDFNVDPKASYRQHLKSVIFLSLIVDMMS